MHYIGYPHCVSTHVLPTVSLSRQRPRPAQPVPSVRRTHRSVQGEDCQKAPVAEGTIDQSKQGIYNGIEAINSTASSGTEAQIRVVQRWQMECIEARYNNCMEQSLLGASACEILQGRHVAGHGQIVVPSKAEKIFSLYASIIWGSLPRRMSAQALGAHKLV